MTNRSLNHFLFSLLLGSCALSSCQRPQQGQTSPGPGTGGGPPALPAEVFTVEPRDLPIEVTAVGSIRSPETTTVSSDTAGIVVFLDTPEGARVEKGHLLARLDDAEARAELKVAEARAENARAVHARVKPLFEDGVASRQALDDAEAELSTAEGLLEEARTNLDKTEIRAPFTGVLGLRRAQLGQYLASGGGITQLTKIDPLEITFSVPETAADRVALGQKVIGELGRCRGNFEAAVVAIDPAVDPASRTLPLLARVPNPEGRLRPGMSVELRLVVGNRERVLAVPREALVRAGTRYEIWVLDADDRARPQVVVPGAFEPELVEIREGLEASARVVASGHQKLRPGAPVTPLDWQPTQNPILSLGAERPDDCP